MPLPLPLLLPLPTSGFQGFVVIVTAQIGAGQMPKLKELFAPLVSYQFL
jgi:hypothetical protein